MSTLNCIKRNKIFHTFLISHVIVSSAFVTIPCMTVESFTATCKSTNPHESQGSRYHHNQNYCPESISSLFAHGDTILMDDEPLSARFQRAVVLQRSGDHLSALKEYQTFVKAAEQCELSPSTYAEVHGNIGAIYTKLRQIDEAKKHFKIALSYREIGSAHVNLALLTLSEGQTSSDPSDGIKALKTAREHCRKAADLNDDVNSVNTAKKLLRDIETMLQSARE
jgi:tetratricopeptide (TPR) repeat protein